MSVSPTEQIVATVPTVTMNGSDMPSQWYNALLEIRVELEFRVPGRASLRFLDYGYALSASSQVDLGTSIAIQGNGPDDSSGNPLLSGEVTGVSVEQGALAEPELVLIVHDRAQRFARSTLVGTYLASSYTDVVQQIGNRHGLEPVVDTIPGTLEYVLQAESDLALLNAIADRTGCDWWVDGSKLYFQHGYSNSRSSTVIPLSLGQNLYTFSVRASGLHPDEVRVDGWDRKQQQLVSGTSPTSGAADKPGADMFSSYVSPGEKLGGSGELFSAGVAVITTEEAQQVADSIRDRAVSAAVTATGRLRHGTQVLPGVKLQVADAGPTSGSYLVTKVEHIFRDHPETRFVAGDRRPTTLVDTLSPGVGVGGSTLQHTGLVVGEVTNIQDEDKTGRVKVRYPGMSSNDESAWARVVAWGGGANRGITALPEVGDEVLIGFEGGDLRQPVVLGGLYGEKSTIPLWDVEDGKVGGRRITSRLGHTIELKDGNDASTQYIQLALAGNEQTFDFAKDKVAMTIPSGVPFTIKAGDSASFEFDASGSLTIKAMNITMQAQGNFQVTSAAMTKVASDGETSLEGAATTVKGDVVQVQSNGPVVIKGTPVGIN